MKTKVSIYADGDIIAMAKAKKLNLSKLFEMALTKELELPTDGEYDIKRRRLELERDIKAKEIDKLNQELNAVNHVSTQLKKSEEIKARKEAGITEPPKTREEVFEREWEQWPKWKQDGFLDTPKMKHEHYQHRCIVIAKEGINCSVNEYIENLDKIRKKKEIK